MLDTSSVVSLLREASSMLQTEVGKTYFPPADEHGESHGELLVRLRRLQTLKRMQGEGYVSHLELGELLYYIADMVE